MSMGIIDIIALGTLVFSILFALYRGLVTELLGISSWILAAFGAVFSYAHMQPIMQKFIENEKLAGLCGSVLIALIILVIMTLINSHINKKLRQSSLSGLDRILGMIFGVIRAVLLMALVYIGISVAISDDQMEELKKSNVSLVYIQKTVNFMKKFIPENVQSDLGISQQETKEKKIGTELKRSHTLPKKSHQKAIDNFVKEVKKDASESIKKHAEKKAKNKLKNAIKKEQNNNTPQYNQTERDAMDKMIEGLIEKDN
ncbi:MAG: CvpA family protein [Alphaproteobacteria bacterium]|nr:CvpA family protein [Alphaproteobacteria bacterium]MBQ3117046.1 CvpA family protein [Alphaproteobacteria bacterium]